MHRHAIAVVYLLLSASGAVAQTSRPPASNPMAVSLARQSIAALTGGATIADVTLTGNVTSSLTSDNDTGTGTFSAQGTAESRVDLTLSTGTWTEIRDSQTGPPKGQWASANQNPHPMSPRNCTTDPVWFFPALTSLGGRPNQLFKYIGQEIRNGTAVQHIRSYRSDPKLPQAVKLRYEALTGVDFYLDTSTMLPVALSFSVHPDDGSDIDLPTVVEFSNYQNINGISVPMRIRKYMQGNLLLDISVSNVTLNSGLANASFAIQPPQAGQ
jgi:hypothetical protein